jgi:hypothetical protein
MRSKVPLSLVLILSVCCGLCGCVELKYSAEDRLDDVVAIRPAMPGASVYFVLSCDNPKDKEYALYFVSAAEVAFEKNGFKIVDNPSEADIIVRARCCFYKKAQGTFLFVLILPVYRFNEDYDGLVMNVAYRTEKGRWSKKYRAYYRGWLEGDRDLASGRILEAILRDIPSSPAKGEKGQNKAENGPFH